MAVVDMNSVQFWRPSSNPSFCNEGNALLQKYKYSQPARAVSSHIQNVLPSNNADQLLQRRIRFQSSAAATLDPGYSARFQDEADESDVARAQGVLREYTTKLKLSNLSSTRPQWHVYQ